MHCASEANFISDKARELYPLELIKYMVCGYDWQMSDMDAVFTSLPVLFQS